MDLLERICKLFEQRLGFKANSLPRGSWECAIKERMDVRNCATLKHYHHILLTDNGEFQALTELIVVPETWFFRDCQAFNFIISWMHKFITAHPLRTARFLSIPSSSGEEAYSIAIALTDSYIPSNRYVIEAIDISQALIKRAQLGQYGKNSFRTIDRHYLDAYFLKQNEQYSVVPKIKSQVYFRQGNIFDDKLFQQRQTYDIIFCRNLLIYLDVEAQKKLITILSSLLSPNGWVIVSPSEVETLRMNGFHSSVDPQACALCIKGDKNVQNIRQTPALISNEKMDEILILLRQKNFSLTVDGTKECFKEAARLADCGEFEKAKKMCIDYLKEHQDDPEGYFLLGVIYHALGEKKLSEDSFKKTIYLMPNHHEALFYLSLLMENKGNHEQGEIYRHRAQRAIDEQSLYSKRGV